MVALRQSIRFKIFAVAAALLLAMIGTSIWSAFSTARVNKQLAAFSEGLFPLALTLGNLRAEMISEREQLHDDGRRACSKGFDARAGESQKLIAQAFRYREQGSELAQLERNRLKFAELGPALSQIRTMHETLVKEVHALCAAPDAQTVAAEMLLVRTRVVELEESLTTLKDDLGTFVSESFHVVEQNERHALIANLSLVGVAALVGLYLAYVVSRGLTVPIHRLRDGALAVQSGRLDSDVAVTTVDEIGDVTRAFNAMLADLRAKEEIKATFGQYVDPRIVSRLIEDEASRSVSGEKQRVTVFFSDLAGFTPIADRLTPGGLVTMMNAYFTQMSNAIREHHGIIDKYIGDGIMAFWVPPFVSPETQAIEACGAALAQFERLARFEQELPELMGLRRDLPPMSIRIGLSSGDAIVGSIGSDVARSFTVMGDVANAGSRLEEANRFYGTRILIDEQTRQMASDAIDVRFIDRAVLKGLSEAGAIYELRGMRGAETQQGVELIGLYEAAYDAYARGAWAIARKGFAQCLALCPDDGPAKAMLARTEQLASTPPTAWDGIWRAMTK